jgi:hypothetical protein
MHDTALGQQSICLRTARNRCALLRVTASVAAVCVGQSTQLSCSGSLPWHSRHCLYSYSPAAAAAQGQKGAVLLAWQAL